MLNRPAFFLDTQTCTGCKTCMIACKDKNDLAPGISAQDRADVVFSGHPSGVYR
jgi:anaerobic dimethyl sulfoxide reductase subunit B (iron-sulfur subunit)